MKGVSFALLLQFGVELVAAMTNLPILPRLRLLPAAALLAWGGATLAVSALYPGYYPGPGAWLQEGNIDAALAAVGAPLAIGDVLARWMLALPGAALAAWGLMASATQRVRHRAALGAGGTAAGGGGLRAVRACWAG